MLALFNSTRAQTLPKWEEKHFILSSGMSGWAALAMEHNTSVILLPVRYHAMPYLLTNRPMGCESNWSSLLAWRKILYAAQTGHMSGWSLSATRVSFWPFSCSFVFKTWPSIFLGIPIFHFLMGGCWWWHCCGCKISSQLGERPSRHFCLTGRCTCWPLIGFFVHTWSSTDQWFSQRSSSQQRLLRGNWGGGSLPVQEGRKTSLWWSGFAAWWCALLFLVQRLSSCTCLFDLTSW